jgi:hypothetical protein
MPRQAIPVSTARAMSKLRHFASLPLRSAVAKTFEPVTTDLLFAEMRGPPSGGHFARLFHWRLWYEIIASIFLLLSLFDKQFEYSLSFWLVGHSI